MVTTEKIQNDIPPQGSGMPSSNSNPAESQSKIFNQDALKQYFEKHHIRFIQDDHGLTQTDQASVYVDDQYRHADMGNVRLNGDFHGDSLMSFRAGEFTVAGDFITHARSIKFGRLSVDNAIIPKAELVKGKTLVAETSVYANDAINIIVGDKIVVRKNFLANKAEVMESAALSIGGTLFATQLKILAENRKIGNDKNLPFHLR